MTPSDMEEAIRNLQDQANRLEQFLPNLSTREELCAVRDQAMRHAVILNEATHDRIKALAEGLEDVRARMATTDELKGLEDRLSAQIGDLTPQIGALLRGRRKL
jgi:hypothetical protein